MRSCWSRDRDRILRIAGVAVEVLTRDLASEVGILSYHLPPACRAVSCVSGSCAHKDLPHKVIVGPK